MQGLTTRSLRPHFYLLSLHSTTEKKKQKPKTQHRPREGLFGLREWANDEELRELVAGAEDSLPSDPQVTSSAPVAAQRGRKRTRRRSSEMSDDFHFSSIWDNRAVSVSAAAGAGVARGGASAVGGDTQAAHNSDDDGTSNTGMFLLLDAAKELLNDDEVATDVVVKRRTNNVSPSSAAEVEEEKKGEVYGKEHTSDVEEKGQEEGVTRSVERDATIQAAANLADSGLIEVGGGKKGTEEKENKREEEGDDGIRGPGLLDVWADVVNAVGQSGSQGQQQRNHHHHHQQQQQELRETLTRQLLATRMWQQQQQQEQQQNRARAAAMQAVASEATMEHRNGLKPVIDVLIQQMAARANELYLMLGPHELVAQTLMMLVVACHQWGACDADIEIAFDQLFGVVAAAAFPGGLGQTEQSMADLRMKLKAEVERTISEDAKLRHAMAWVTTNRIG